MPGYCDRMRHFGVLVLVDKDNYDPVAEAERLLAPYDEGLEVDEYETDCWCVGREAEVAAREAMNAAAPDYDIMLAGMRTEFRGLFQEICEAAGGEAGLFADPEAVLPLIGDIERREQLRAAFADLQTRWDQAWDALEEIRERTETCHPAFAKPDRNCDNCSGSGRTMSTTNPRGKWDWYSIPGGRWTGVLDPEYDPDADPRNFSPCDRCGATGVRYWDSNTRAPAGHPEPGQRESGHVEAAGPAAVTAPAGVTTRECNGCDGTGTKRNWDNAPFEGDVVALAQVPEDLDLTQYFYAIITPDGAWHARGDARGEMGWFGMSSDSMDRSAWSRYVQRLRNQHRDQTIAVVCDCHV